MNQLDKGTGALLMLLSIVVFIRASSYPDAAGGYVKILSVILFLLSLLLLIHCIKKAPALSPEEIRRNFSGIRWPRLLLTLLWTLLYVYSMNRIGFIVGSIVFLLGELLLLGVRNGRHLIGISGITTIILFIAFGKLLGVRLPAGILGKVL